MLYKYVSLARKSVLENGLIRFSQPSAFNDPFDLNPNFSLLGDDEFNSSGRVANADSLNLMMNTLAPGIRTLTKKLAGFPGTYSLRANDIARATLDEIYGVLSLTDQPDNLLMWAHYADCHKGFVIQFDETHDFFSSRVIDGVEFGLTKVEYLDMRPRLSHRTFSSPTVLYRKSPEWAYESEWRLVRPIRNASKVVGAEPYPIALFEVPLAAIKGVIIGVAVSHEERVQLFELLGSPERNHITVYQTRLSDEHYKLEVHPSLDGKIDSNALNGRVLPPNANLMITIE